MSPKSKEQCQICSINQSKYICASCKISYCSVVCYQRHKESSCREVAQSSVQTVKQKSGVMLDSKLVEEMPEISCPPDEPSEVLTTLRPLTSLNWPYIPEESAYPDPLKRDDPKPLQLRHYESIATSPAIRRVLQAYPRLPDLLTSIDKLRGPDRETALRRALAVDNHRFNDRTVDLDEDQRAMKEFTEAVEAAIKGQEPGELGLDWQND